LVSARLVVTPKPHTTVETKAVDALASGTRFDPSQECPSRATCIVSAGQTMDVPAAGRLVAPEYWVLGESGGRRDHHTSSGGEKYSVALQVVLDERTREGYVPLADTPIQQPLSRLVQKLKDCITVSSIGLAKGKTVRHPKCPVFVAPRRRSFIPRLDHGGFEECTSNQSPHSRTLTDQGRPHIQRATTHPWEGGSSIHEPLAERTENGSPIPDRRIVNGDDAHVA
jgi:hypothetical protein